MARFSGFFASLGQAAHRAGRSRAAILAEYIRIWLARRRIGFSEYIEFRLFEQDLSFAQKLQFGGYRTQAELEGLLIDDYSKILSIDKVTMYALFQGLGLPIPALRGVYGRRVPAGLCPSLLDAEELLACLDKAGALPMYLKPAFGAYGRGNLLVREAVDGGFRLGDGTIVSRDGLPALLQNPSGLGWLLQEPLYAHPDIAARCGPKVSGVRIHTFLASGGPTITRVVWKINVGNQDSDNFRDGQSGNMAAAVDPDTGIVRRVINGIGFSQAATDHARSDRHLEQGAGYCGYRLPCWDEVRRLVLDAALALPGYINPGWDIAICRDGPRILEVNSFGDLDFPQHAHRLGYVDDAYVALLKDRQLDHLLGSRPQPRRLCPGNGRTGHLKCHWPW